MSVKTRIAIRLSEELRSQLDTEAEQLGIGLSKLIRSKLSAKKVVKPKIFINHNNIISFEDLAKSKIIYEDVLI